MESNSQLETCSKLFLFLILASYLSVLNDFQSVPNVLNAEDEPQIYLYLAAKQQQLDEFDRVRFWRAVEDPLPKLTALRHTSHSPWLLLVKRSFLKYGSVPSPLRQSLSIDSLKAYCSVFYNQAVD